MKFQQKGIRSGSKSITQLSLVWYIHLHKTNPLPSIKHCSFNWFTQILNWYFHFCYLFFSSEKQTETKRGLLINLPYIICAYSMICVRKTKMKLPFKISATNFKLRSIKHSLFFKGNIVSCFMFRSRDKKINCYLKDSLYPTRRRF